MIFKQAYISDVSELGNLFIDYWRECSDTKVKSISCDRSKLFLEAHINRDLFVFTAQENKQIVATCAVQTIEMIPTSKDNGKIGTIYFIYTKPEFRKQGIQIELLKNVIDYAKTNKISRLKFGCTDDKTLRLFTGLLVSLGFDNDDSSMVLNLEEDKIVFENMPEIYEVGNLIFFKEPYHVDEIAWGRAHSGCMALALRDSDNSSLDVDIVVYPKSKEFNGELFPVLKENKDKYVLLGAYSGGTLTEAWN